MKEYDLDAYSRKWRGTSGLFKTKDGRTHQAMYDEFFSITRNKIGVQAVVTLPTGVETQKFSVHCDADGYEPMEILYWPIKSGWYPRGTGYGLLTRKHTRAFQVGICTSSHLCMAADQNGVLIPSQPMSCRFLEPVEPMPFDSAQPWGILNFRLWWKNQKLMYLNQTIGMYSNGKWLLEDADYLPHVQPYLGDACQITF